MDRHPFANPVHSYSRVTSGEYGPPDPYANLHSFPPMSSEDSFRRWHIPATPPQPLPSHSDRSGYTYNTYNDNDNLNDSDGMHNGGLDNRDGRLPRWRRALKKMKRQAKRSLYRLRRTLDLL